jgi:hypothetical protein
LKESFRLFLTFSYLIPIVPKLYDMDFRSSESTELMGVEWHYSFLIFRPHENGQSQGIQQTTVLLYILMVL